VRAVVIETRFNDRAGAEAELPDLVSRVVNACRSGNRDGRVESDDGAQALAGIARDTPAGAVSTTNVEPGEAPAHA